MNTALRKSPGFRTTAPLPISARVGLGNQHAPGSPLPISKLAGNPATILRASDPIRIPTVVSPYKGAPPTPAPAFHRTFDGVDPTPGISTIDRKVERLATEHADRQARRRAAPRVALEGRKRTPMDFARTPRVKPRSPARQEGVTAVTRAPALSGVKAGQLNVPILTVERLADDGVRAAAGPDVDTMPISTYSLAPSDLAPEKVQAAVPEGPDAFQWVYAAAAVFVVFLMVRG